MPSPRDVPTYDHKPEMSAAEAAAQFAAQLARGGRGGTAVPLRDHQLRQSRHGRAHRRASRPPRGRSRPSTGASGEVVDAVQQTGGGAIVTADHGNADEMLEPDGSPHTAHSTNPVPLIVTVEGSPGGRRCWPTSRRPRSRCSGIPQPAAMTGVAAGRRRPAATGSARSGRYPARPTSGDPDLTPRRLVDQVADAVDLVLDRSLTTRSKSWRLRAVEVHDHERRDDGRDQQEQEHQCHEAAERDRAGGVAAARAAARARGAARRSAARRARAGAGAGAWRACAVVCVGRRGRRLRGGSSACRRGGRLERHRGRCVAPAHAARIASRNSAALR